MFTAVYNSKFEIQLKDQNEFRSSSDFIECRRTLLFTRIIFQYIFYDEHKSCKAKTKHYVKFKLPTHDTQYTLI